MTPRATSAKTSRERFEEMLEKGERTFTVLNRLLWAFSVTIIGCIATISTVIYQLNHVHKDIEYVRETAAPKSSVIALEKLHVIETAAMRDCITDTNFKMIMDAVDRKTTPVVDAIIMWNNTIPPRGSIQQANKEKRESDALNGGAE